MYNRSTISDYFKSALAEIRSGILHESEEQIVGCKTDDLACYCCGPYDLPIIELDSGREANWEHKNFVKIIPAHQRESFYSGMGDLEYSCERVVVEIPIKHNEQIHKISQLEASSFSISYSADEFIWSTDSVSCSVEVKGYGFAYEEDKIANEINERMQRFNQLMQWKNDDIKMESVQLLNNVKGIIEGRKQEIQKNKDKIKSLTQKINIPLKKNISQSVQRIILDSKPIITRIKPKPNLPEEYVLDESKVNDILDVLDNQAKSFERTPRALVSLGETELRDLLLANLNSIFEGKATGETFSNKGKTDVYLNINKGSILVFECKLWGGRKILEGTIDQLRGYLTWRHNFGVVIFFVKIKSFSKIMTEIATIIQGSQSFRNSFKQINDTHFCAVHNLEDEDREVKIHYLFYNLFSE